MARVIHGAYTTVAGSVAGLASDTTMLAGRAMAEVNSSSAGLDYQYSGYIGIATCAGNRKLEFWAYSMTNASAFPVSAGGMTDLTGIKDGLKFLDSIPVTTTAAHRIHWGPYSIAKACDGFPPARHGIIILQNTGDPLQTDVSAHMVGYRTVEVSSA